MKRIRLAENFRAVFYAPFYAAITLGYHAREGIEIELIQSASPGGGTASLLDGSIDVTWGGPMRSMKAHDEARGPALVCFCDIVRKDPFYLVGRPGAAPFRLADLAKMRFASVSEVPTPWLCLQHDLREAGIDPGSLDRIPNRTMAQNLEALGRGEIDIAQMFEPYASQAEREGTGKVLHAASGRGDTAYTTFLTLRPLVAKNRDAYAAMVRAANAMQGWLASHTGKDLAEVVAPYYPTVDLRDLAAALTRYKSVGLWASDTNVSRAGFDRLAASLKSGGFISRVPAYEDCVVDALIGA